MTMQQVLVIGAGKIGQLIASWLATTGDYQVHLADVMFESDDLGIDQTARRFMQLVTLDAKDKSAVSAYVKAQAIGTIISSLPFYANENMADIALTHSCHYFDLTEDTKVSQHIRAKAQDAKKTIATQCGLAPGFISILAKEMMQPFSKIESVSLRVGALPEQAHHALKYALTWSTEGLINEYANPCFGILNEKLTSLQPLEDLETIELDGALYEAFNTSGGLGSLAETFQGQVKNLNYKTVRYPGHCEKIRFLMYDLKLIEDRATLKKIFEKAIPRTEQDIVLVYVSVDGWQKDHFFEKTYFRKYYPKIIAGKLWSAIQVSSAAGICAVVDLVLTNPAHYQGVLLQENISLKIFLENRFGQHFAH